MSATLNDLYYKYVEEIGKNLEDDRYFRYLYEMIEAGNKEFSQQHQILHKVVDERWLTTIEDSLDALSKVVDNPRRSIERQEEVVPVSLAKKITVDSVRHLSLNTQFIASDDEDDIQPTKILNVSNEETYNLYENRFIYHLIQRLVTFVDKRTDVIFWSTGDETQNTLTLNSHIDDAYEQIDYRLEMKIKNVQSFAENDADNINVFMRIDRVRRLVMALKTSSFCQIMAGCEKVRSPIQRTNLLVKDPNYRKCYQLWQFLETYDELGFSIEVENQALEFDEEYVIQMYTNLIANYVVFKSITEGDARDIKNADSKRKRVIKPRFNKEIREEIVDSDYEIPEVEVRQVLIEEVTQAQLDAEQKLADEIEARKAVEKALSEAEASAHHSMIQAEYAASARFEAEDIAKEATEKVKELEGKIHRLDEEKDGLLIKLQEKDELLTALNEQLSVETKDYIKQLEDQQKKYQEAIEDLADTHEKNLQEMREEFEELNQNVAFGYIEEMDKMEKKAAEDVETLQIQSENNIAEAIETYEARINQQKNTYHDMLEEKELQYQDSVDSLKKQFEDSMSIQRATLEAEMQALQDDYEKKLAFKETQNQENLARLQKEAEELNERLTLDYQTTLKEERKTAQTKFDQFRNEAQNAYMDLQTSSENKLIQTKNNAEKILAETKAAYEKERNTLQCEMTKQYENLKAADRQKMAEDERAHKEALQRLKAEAEKTASILNAEIEALKAHNDMLQAQYKKMQSELKTVKDTANTLEAELIVERDLKNAIEQKVTAQTVMEFSRAKRAENKAKKAQSKLK